MFRNPLQAQIHIARKELGIEEDDYRALLERATGQRSSAGLTDPQRQTVLVELRALGFKPTRSGGRFRSQSKKPYVRLIFALWGELKRKGIWRGEGRESLLQFVESKTGVADPEWLTHAQATPVIAALQEMVKRGVAGNG